MRWLIDRDANAVASWITHCSRSFVFDHREQHVAHFALILRRHHDDVGHGAKISNVEEAMVSLTVTTRDATTIQAELYVQVLNTNVMDQLVKTSL
jgi:hypothetical protein